MTSRVRRLAGGRNSSIRRENPPNENVRSMYDCVIMHDGEGLRKPMARSGHRIVADEANLYCFGGYNPQLNNLQNETFGLFPNFGSSTSAPENGQKSRVTTLVPLKLLPTRWCYLGKASLNSKFSATIEYASSFPFQLHNSGFRRNWVSFRLGF